MLGRLVRAHQKPNEEDGGSAQCGQVEDGGPTAHNVLSGAEKAGQRENEESP